MPDTWISEPAARRPRPDLSALDWRQMVLGAARVLWIGERAPFAWFESSLAAIDPRADHRLGPELHGTFDLVYVVEPDLATVKSWPLVLDEAIRAAKVGGHVVVRYRDSLLLTSISLKHWLAGRSDVRFVDEASTRERVWTLAVERTAAERPSRSVTFALVADGRRMAGVEAFLVSANRVAAAGWQVQTLVCGPDSPEMSAAVEGLGGSLVAQPEEFQERGWITRKKNLLVAAATGDVIVVAHDRYTIPRTFLEHLDAFGLDFDVLVPRQRLPDGRRLPDWVATDVSLGWSTPATLTYGDWHPAHYVNGGIVVARTEVLRRTPWNESLFWNQGEDVEFSQRLRDRGVTARFSRLVEVESFTVRPDLIAGFSGVVDLPGEYTELRDHRLLAVDDDASYRSTVGWLWEVGAPTEALAGRGVWHDHVWSSWKSDLIAAEGEFAELVVPLGDPAGVAGEMWLEIGTRDDLVVDLSVAGAEPTRVVADRGVLRLDLTGPIARGLRFVRLTLRSVDGPLVVSSLRFDTHDRSRWSTTSRRGPGRLRIGEILGDGWHAPEPWGVWSKGSSTIIIPRAAVRGRTVADLEVRVAASGEAGDRIREVEFDVRDGATGQWTIESGARFRWVSLDLPETPGDVEVSFSTTAIAPPPSALGFDRRLLGLGVRRVRIRRARSRRELLRDAPHLPAHPRRERPELAPPAQLRFGAGDPGAAYLGEGWENPADDSVLATADGGDLIIPVSTAPTEITVELRGVYRTESRRRAAPSVVGVFLNGVPLGSLAMTRGPRPSSFSFPIPAHLVALSPSELRLAFETTAVGGGIAAGLELHSVGLA